MQKLSEKTSQTLPQVPGVLFTLKGCAVYLEINLISIIKHILFQRDGCHGMLMSYELPIAERSATDENCCSHGHAYTIQPLWTLLPKPSTRLQKECYI